MTNYESIIVLSIIISPILIYLAYNELRILYWSHFHKKYGYPCYSIHVPMKIYGNFNYKFFLHDAKGNVHEGATSIFEAIKKHKTSGLYIVKVNDN